MKEKKGKKGEKDLKKKGRGDKKRVGEKRRGKKALKIVGEKIQRGNQWGTPVFEGWRGCKTANCLWAGIL